jgi:hypothetical protein
LFRSKYRAGGSAILYYILAADRGLVAGPARANLQVFDVVA